MLSVGAACGEEPIPPPGAVPLVDPSGFWFACLDGAGPFTCAVFDDDGNQFTSIGEIYRITALDVSYPTMCGGPCFWANQLSQEVDTTRLGTYTVLEGQLTISVAGCDETLTWPFPEFKHGSVCLDFDGRSMASLYTGAVTVR